MNVDRYELLWFTVSGDVNMYGFMCYVLIYVCGNRSSCNDSMYIVFPQDFITISCILCMTVSVFVVCNTYVVYFCFHLRVTRYLICDPLKCIDKSDYCGCMFRVPLIIALG